MTGGAARWVALAWVVCSCAPVPVELGAGGGPSQIADGDIEMHGVPRAAIDQLRAGAAGPDKGVDLLYPAPPELAIPADLAPIVFEGRAGPEPKPMMPMMPAAPMMPAPMMPMGGKMMPPKPMEEASSARVFELSLGSGENRVRVYTLATSASLPADRWQRVLRSAVGQRVRVRVRALRVSDGEISGSKPLEIEVRPALPAGEILTWSATSGGLARAAIGSDRETRLAVPGVTGCVGCHAVSRDGRRVLAADGGRGRLVAWSTVGAAPLQIALTGQGDAFGSFDPSAARIAVAQAARLAIFDADTGLLLSERNWGPATALGSLDWSPDGRTLAIALADGIARVRIGLDASIGELEPIVGDMPKDERELHPSYSPDGTFIAFERRKGPVHEAKDASLWIVPAAGGEPRELRAATSGAKLAGAPSFLPGEPGRAYVVFAARRAVGSFNPAEGQRQLFAAAVDLQSTGGKEDPSHAAFWLPFQQRGSSYLGAQWASATLACSASPEICDGADDDCDGTVDEECCAPEAERCDGALDEDCDGTVDEGCGCAFQERCGDGVDDDCDLVVDEEPCTPGGK